MTGVGYTIRPPREDERTWLRARLRERWHGEVIVGRGRIRRLNELRALVALVGDEPVGIVTYALEGERAELLTLDSLREGAGVGWALIEAVADSARRGGASELVVMTTNDNLRALRLYQRAGFRLHELRPGAVEQARRLKPSIPALGHDGIPLRDEIDLIRALDGEGGRPRPAGGRPRPAG
jgi:ribosomal protein S18 acetylase RimI-like enzyme